MISRLVWGRTLAAVLFCASLLAGRAPACGQPARVARLRLRTGGEWRTYGRRPSPKFARSGARRKVVSRRRGAAAGKPPGCSQRRPTVRRGDFTGNARSSPTGAYTWPSTRGWVFRDETPTRASSYGKTEPPILVAGVNGSVAIAHRVLSSDKPRGRGIVTDRRPTARNLRMVRGHRKRQTPHDQAATASKPRAPVYVAVSRTQKFRACPAGDSLQPAPYVVRVSGQATGKVGVGQASRSTLKAGRRRK